jgi:hypothetical protein
MKHLILCKADIDQTSRTSNFNDPNQQTYQNDRQYDIDTEFMWFSKLLYDSFEFFIRFLKLVINGIHILS